MKEAKYKIGSPVWFIGAYKIECKRINRIGEGIVSLPADGSYEILSFKYGVAGSTEDFEEEDLFPTKESLIASL